MGYPGGHTDWPLWLAALGLLALVILAILISTGQVKA